MSLYDDPSERLMKYDGTCWKCHGNPRLCDGESGECGALKALLLGPREFGVCKCDCGCDAPSISGLCSACRAGDHAEPGN